MAVLSSGTRAQNVYYVDGSVTISGMGNSWGSPYKFLEEGLDAANADAVSSPFSRPQVWVREGTYITNGAPPTAPITDADRLNSFVMRARVSVYGGFVGTEVSLQQRQGSASQTILSGDALADSQPGAVSTLVDDSYHVVTVPAGDPLNPILTVSNWVLDSVTVEFGNANVWTPGSSTTGWPANRYDGGGIYFDSVPNLPPSSSAGSFDWVVRNVTVQNCRAIGRGAGVYVYAGGGSSQPSSPFGWCNATPGPLSALPTAPAAFSDCIIRNNVADWHTIAINLTSRGEAGLGDDPATPQASGGGFFVERCGPGLYLQNCIIDRNIARNYGGGLQIYALNGEVVLNNCQVSNNFAQAGAGVYSIGTLGSARAHIAHCTVAGNRASAGEAGLLSGGGGLFIEAPSFSGGQLLSLRNSIVHGNFASQKGQPQLDQDVAGPGLVANPPAFCAQYSNIGPNFSLATAGSPPPPWVFAGVQTGDPLFVNVNTSNFRLQDGSPCIDAGNDLLFMPEADDLDGDTFLLAACLYDLDLLAREVNLGQALQNGGVDGGLLNPGVSDLGCYEVR